MAGWVRATSGPVKASLLYRRFEAGVATGEAGVNATTVPATRFVTFSVRDEVRQMLARSAPLTLLPPGHGAQNMVDLFDLNSFSGWLDVTSTAPIVSLSLNAEAAPVLSSLPPGEVDASAQ